MFSQLEGKKVVVFGGTGFIGSQLVYKLCKESCQVDIITRKINVKKRFFSAGEPGQVSTKKIEFFDEKNLEILLKDANIVFNLIGILNESKNTSFNFVHTEIPKMIAKVAAKMKVRSFLHLSALNIEKVKKSLYAQSKLNGEMEIKKYFPNAIIIRPSVVFGKGDNFTNLFYNISKLSPFLPIIGTPKVDFWKGFLPKIDFKKKVRFQPLYIGDLVDYLLIISNKKNRSYDLAGPNIRTFRQIFDIILSAKNKKKIYLPIPFFIAEILGFFFSLLPKPLLTSDQIKLLKVDSVSKKGLKNLQKYIKNPRSMEVKVASYL